MIYDAMLEMFTLGQPVDFVTVLDKLKQNPAFDQVNGKTYLLQLAQIVPSSPMWKPTRASSGINTTSAL